MRTWSVVLFAIGGLVVGAAAAAAVVGTCSVIHRQPWPRDGSPDWTVLPGIVLLVLGPVAGGIAGLLFALRPGSGPR